MVILGHFDEGFFFIGRVSGMETGTSLTWTDREAIPANALIARGLGKPWKHQGQVETALIDHRKPESHPQILNFGNIACLWQRRWYGNNEGLLV
jgi:hypothetical protein